MRIALFFEFSNASGTTINLQHFGKDPTIVAPNVGDQVSINIGSIQREGTVRTRRFVYAGSEGRDLHDELDIQIFLQIDEIQYCAAPSVS